MSLKDGEEYQTSVKWVRNMQFVGSDDRNHDILIDTGVENGGEDSGIRPGRLLLLAVSSCSAQIVIDVLRRSRVEIDSLEVFSKGTQEVEYPKYYKQINLKYRFRGSNLDSSKLERAIRLAEEKYCSISATLAGRAIIKSDYEIIESV